MPTQPWNSCTCWHVVKVLAWWPDSVFSITEDERFHTPSGSYRLVSVERKCDNTYLAGGVSVLIDEVKQSAWIGSVGTLPAEAAGIDPLQLRSFIEGFLPGAIATNLRQSTRIEWDRSGGVGSGLMPFSLMVDSGYGEFRRPAAATSDGRFVALGYELPLDEDPVAYRRELLRGEDHVIWDHPGNEPEVEIVEVSDLECPGCKVAWKLVHTALNLHGDSVRHGMVSFPLTSIHPWAFRAASALWCVAEQDPLKALDFKELFYSLQKDMEVSMVTPTAVSFALGKGLNEETFRACYLRPPSLDAVHGQLSVGNAIGVAATPTYVVNGWVVQMPREEWFLPMIDRLLDGEEPGS